MKSLAKKSTKKNAPAAAAASPKRAKPVQVAAPPKPATMTAPSAPAKRAAPRDDGLRDQLLSAALRMAASGLTPLKSGNVSVRSAEGMLITPSGRSYDTLTAEDLVHVRSDGSVEGQGQPSSEWQMHAAIYRAKPEACAIVHAHSPFATALACVHRDIPAFHYMVARAGGDRIACAPYATFGSADLARNVLAGLGPRRACLLANHGALATGAGLEEAYQLAWEVETLAGQYWRALQVGVPRLLDKAEMARVVERFKTYGNTPAAAKTDL